MRYISALVALTIFLHHIETRFKAFRYDEKRQQTSDRTTLTRVSRFNLSEGNAADLICTAITETCGNGFRRIVCTQICKAVIPQFIADSLKLIGLVWRGMFTFWNVYNAAMKPVQNRLCVELSGISLQKFCNRSVNLTEMWKNTVRGCSEICLYAVPYERR